MFIFHENPNVHTIQESTFERNPVICNALISELVLIDLIDFPILIEQERSDGGILGTFLAGPNRAPRPRGPAQKSVKRSVPVRSGLTF